MDYDPIVAPLCEALKKLVELEDRSLEGISSGAPTAEEWRNAFDEARYILKLKKGQPN